MCSAPLLPSASWLRAPRALGLLWDGAEDLWLLPSHRRVCLGEQSRSAPQRSQEELPRHHQITVALGVWEGVARATGADAPGTWSARCSGWQRLATHLMSHLGGDTWRSFRWSTASLLFSTYCYWGADGDTTSGPHTRHEGSWAANILPEEHKTPWFKQPKFSNKITFPFHLSSIFQVTPWPSTCRPANFPGLPCPDTYC